MPKTKMTMTSTGLTDYIDSLGLITKEFPVLTEDALKAQLTVVAEAIRRNWVSLGGGRPGDFIYDSVGLNVSRGANGNDAVGTAGVFHLDAVAAKHGRTQKEGKRKPLRASQIAYWVEFGTRRLRSGERKAKNVEYPEEALAKNIVGIPFMTNAGYTTVEQQEQAFMDNMESSINRLMK